MITTNFHFCLDFLVFINCSLNVTIFFWKKEFFDLNLSKTGKNLLNQASEAVIF